VPLGTVKSRIARGIVQLKEILSDGPRDSSLHKEGISSLADRDEPGGAPGGTLICWAVSLR